MLIKAALGADLLVVDAPRQLLAGPMFAHRLIYAAACPVVVMPPADLGRAAVGAQPDGRGARPQRRHGGGHRRPARVPAPAGALTPARTGPGRTAGAGPGVVAPDPRPD